MNATRAASTATYTSSATDDRAEIWFERKLHLVNAFSKVLRYKISLRKSDRNMCEACPIKACPIKACAERRTVVCHDTTMVTDRHISRAGHDARLMRAVLIRAALMRP